MADTRKKTQETGQTETTMRGSSSQQTGEQTGRETTTRGSSGMQSDLPDTQTGPWTGAPPEAVTHQPGQQRSEDAGMQYTSAMIRESRGSSEYAKGLCDRELAMSERERGMSERERGMGDRERAMYDRECAMSDRERSGMYGESRREPEGGMGSGQSRMSGPSGSSMSGSNR